MTVILAVAAMASVVNFWRVANLTVARDWPADAAIVDAVALIGRMDRSGGVRPVRIGVDRLLYPVVCYYAGDHDDGPTAFDVMVLPGDGLPVDYVYVPRSVRIERGEAIHYFAASDTVLWRGGRVPAPALPQPQ